MKKYDNPLNKKTPTESIREAAGVQEKPNKESMRQYGINLPPELYEKLQAISYWDRVGLSAFVRKTLITEIERLEKKKGSPYEPSPKNK